jgi:hypothetical protein
MDALESVLRASQNLNADINHGNQIPTLHRDIVQVSPSDGIPLSPTNPFCRPFRTPILAPRGPCYRG